MGSAKRERRKQGRPIRLEEAMAEQKRKQRWRSVRNVVLIVVAIVVALFVTSRLFGKDDKSSVATNSTASLGSETDASTTTGVTTPGGFAFATYPCPNADG